MSSFVLLLTQDEKREFKNKNMCTTADLAKLAQQLKIFRLYGLLSRSVIILSECLSPCMILTVMCLSLVHSFLW